MKWQYYHSVWTVMVVGWIANYMVRAGLSPVLVPIQKEFGFSYAEAGMIASALFYAYAAMMFPAGIVGDRFGHKIVLVLCTLWWAVCSFLTGLATTFAGFFLARFFTGIGQGSYFSNDRPIIAAYTPRDKLGIGQGISFIGLGTGMSIGYILAGVISTHFGWRAVFFIFALPSLAAALLILKVIREPRGHPAATIAPPAKAPLSTIFRSADLWKLYIGGIPGVYAVWMAGTWVPAMFEELGVRTIAMASLLSSLIGIAAIPGLILTGWVSDRLFRLDKGRKGLIAFEFVMMGLFMFLMGLAVGRRWSPYAAAAIVFGIGFFAWGHWAAFYALIADIVPADIRGACYGLTNAINFLGSLIAPPLTGWIKDTTASFEWGCYVSALFILMGAAVVFSIKPAFRLRSEAPVPQRSKSV